MLHIHTTCRDCGGPLLVTNNDTVHPLCQRRPTKAERLATEWLLAVETGDATREAELQAQINELDNRPPRLHQAALAYAAWGWPVFPLKPPAKTPATRNGFKDATTNHERIDNWWKRHPKSNIGLPTGHTFDVIDFDPPDGGRSFIEMADDLPHIHGQVCTASGGIHLYVKPTGDGNATRIAPGVDWRGKGGYVVAPPSTLGEYRNWSWTHQPSPTIKTAIA